MVPSLPPMTLVLVELDGPAGDLVPASLVPTFGANFTFRVRPTLMLGASDKSIAEIEAALADYPLRAAIGARRVWDLFPEYRNEFVVEISRWVRRETGRGLVALRDTYLGDRLVSPQILMSSHPYYAGLPQTGFTWWDGFDSTEVDLGEFAYLRSYAAPESVEIEGKGIYFCDRFAIRGAEPVQIAPGVQFLTARAMMESTELLARAQKQSEAPFTPAMNQRPLIPDQFSGAFLMDEGEPQGEFGRAQIGRLMAAAAISAGVSGIYLGRLQFTPGGMNAQFPPEENTFRPFGDNSHPRANVISQSDPVLTAILKLFEKVTPASYHSAKDDYRLLALDTVEDSRSSNAFPPQYAQLWMGIERLLPFRTETTSQRHRALGAGASRRTRGIFQDGQARLRPAVEDRPRLQLRSR